MTATFPPASLREYEYQRVLQGHRPRKYQEAIRIEQARTTGECCEHNGLLVAGIEVSERVWTLPEVEVATTCRYHWLNVHVLGLGTRTSHWNRLQQTGLRAATAALYNGLDPRGQAERALRRAASRLQRGGEWHPGLLWESSLLELLGTIERAVATRDFLPVGWQPVAHDHELLQRFSAAGHTFRLRLEIDRLEYTPTGLILTSYQRHGQSESALTRDAQLALLMEATGAVAARTFDLQTGKMSGLLHQVMRPTHESPITLARAVLAGLGDALRDGRVDAQPGRPRCRNCPVSSLCRASVQQGAR